MLVGRACRRWGCTDALDLHTKSLRETLRRAAYLEALCGGTALPAFWLMVTACASPVGDVHPVESASSAIVNGTDDRGEYFEAGLEIQELVREAVVVLMHRRFADALVDRHPERIPSLEKSRRLCPGSRFAAQPSAAYCSGVLVDWDLVLTAEHCIRGFPLNDVRAVFGYYYQGDGTIATAPGDVLKIRDVVVTGDEHEDFAWLRLDSGSESRRRPAPIYTKSMRLEQGSPVIVASATEGVPIKVDNGAWVYTDADGDGKYFVANSDTFQGSSGGAALDERVGVVGILTDGERDYTVTDQGCRSPTERAEATAGPKERFLYAHTAVSALCSRMDISLCDDECEQPCRANRRSLSTPGGCGALGPSEADPSHETTLRFLFLASAAVAHVRHRRARARCRHE